MSEIRDFLRGDGAVIHTTLYNAVNEADAKVLAAASNPTYDLEDIRRLSGYAAGLRAALEFIESL